MNCFKPPRNSMVCQPLPYELVLLFVMRSKSTSGSLGGLSRNRCFHVVLGWMKKVASDLLFCILLYSQKQQMPTAFGFLPPMRRDAEHVSGRGASFLIAGPLFLAMCPLNWHYMYFRTPKLFTYFHLLNPKTIYCLPWELESI